MSLQRCAFLAFGVIALCLTPADALPAQTVVAHLIGDADGYRVEPKTISVPIGGSVTFIVTSGGPHNIVFEDTLGSRIDSLLNARMSNTIAHLAGPMLLQAGDSYTISFAELPAGEYGFHCMPHAALNESGTIVVGGTHEASTPTPAATIVSPSAASRNEEAAILKNFLRDLVTHEEIFFADSSRYTGDANILRRASALKIPDGVRLTLTAPSATSWQAIVNSRSTACAVGISTPNPFGSDASDGQIVCRPAP